MLEGNALKGYASRVFAVLDKQPSYREVKEQGKRIPCLVGRLPNAGVGTPS